MRLHRDVAVKRLNKGGEGDALRVQLLREARVLATMQHPNIVSVYDVSSHADFDEIVMELIVGVPLNVLVKRHLLQYTDFRSIATQILNALAAAHKVGVLHCDLKPENIMLCMVADDQYEAKIYDFGMSHAVAEVNTAGQPKLVGSIYVMAPELFTGEPPSAQSDLYALGCLFYYLLTGMYPFYGDSSVQVMAMHISGNFPALSSLRADLSPELCTWVETLIAKNKEDRFDSCREAMRSLFDLKESTTEEGEFTLPVDLELESNNSRVIRPISVASLSVDNLDGTKETTKLLSNTVTHTAPVGSKPNPPSKKGKETGPQLGSEQTVLPDGAEWYFTKDEAVKGPVTISQLKNLCITGKVEKETLVWHPLFGEWVEASACAETNTAFVAVHEKQEAKQEFVEEVEKAPSWFGVEMLVLLVGGIVAGVFAFFKPELRIWIVSVYALVVCLVGLISSRRYQLKNGKRWFVMCLLFPVLGDIFHATLNPTGRVILSSVMMILGGMGLSALIFFGKLNVQEFGYPAVEKPSDENASTFAHAK